MKTEILGKAFVQVLSSVLLMCFNELAKYRTLKPKEKQRKWRPRKKKKPLMVMQEIVLNQTISAIAFIMISEDHSSKK